MKFDKEYVVKIEMDFPEPEEMGFTDEEFSEAWKELPEEMPEEIHKMICEELEEFEANGVKVKVTTAEVKHGEWVRSKQRYYCSCCENYANTHLVLSYTPEADYKIKDYLDNFCPHCGARMDGENNG